MLTLVDVAPTGAPRCVKCPNMPVCVCVHVIYGSCGPSSELEALGTNVDDEGLDIEGERVQRVLNPGLLEGSLSFSHSSLSLPLALSSFS